MNRMASAISPGFGKSTLIWQHGDYALQRGHQQISVLYNAPHLHGRLIETG
jgi:hypothetical protein